MSGEPVGRIGGRGSWFGWGVTEVGNRLNNLEGIKKA